MFHTFLYPCIYVLPSTVTLIGQNEKSEMLTYDSQANRPGMFDGREEAGDGGHPVIASFPRGDILFQNSQGEGEDEAHLHTCVCF